MEIVIGFLMLAGLVIGGVMQGSGWRINSKSHFVLTKNRGPKKARFWKKREHIGTHVHEGWPTGQ